MRYLQDLRDGESVIEHYLCKQKQSLKSRAGKTYLSLKLQDKTGTVDAKIWELNNQIQSFEEGDFIKIDATVLMYQNSLQLNVRKVRRSQEGEYEPMDYIPSTDKDISVLYEQLTSYINTITNSFIKELLENVFIKNQEEIEQRAITTGITNGINTQIVSGLSEGEEVIYFHLNSASMQNMISNSRRPMMRL